MFSSEEMRKDLCRVLDKQICSKHALIVHPKMKKNPHFEVSELTFLEFLLYCFSCSYSTSGWKQGQEVKYHQ